MIVQKNLTRIHALCKQHEEKKMETQLEELSKKNDKDKKDSAPNVNSNMEDVAKPKVSFED